jgi:putative DNA primase/helicase
MNFLDFCRAHGILIEHLPPVGLWRRYPTEDKPRHKNGAVKWMLDHGFCQNHATEVTVSVWRPDEPVKINRRDLAEQARRAEQDTLRRQAEAAKKAAWILHQCQYASHPYLKAKGFPDEVGNVWVREGEHLLVIPMRIGNRLVGVQLIDSEGKKNFLSGQVTGGAEYVIDNRGVNILAEGYATALSVRKIMKSLKMRYKIRVTFSAGNLLKVARTLDSALVIADNDVSGVGQKTAIETGFPYWISDTVGEDFNDYHLRVGIFKATQAIYKVLQQHKLTS